MTDEHQQIDEEELHAFVDGHLGPERQRVVEAYLAAHPEAAQRLDDYRSVNDGLHSLYDDVLAEPLPARLRRAPDKLASPRWRKVVPAGLALAAGICLGWFGHDVISGPEAFTRLLVGDAITAHRIFALDSTHPIEVGVGQQERLLTWLQYRLGEAVAPPDLTKFGYELLGARAIPGPAGQAVQLRYRNRQGAQITLLISRVNRSQREVPVRPGRADDLSAIFWVDEGFACAMVGPADAADLRAAAESAYRQLTNT